MKRLWLILLSALSVLQTAAAPPARPKLVVGIVVDQMRWDYLYRFAAHYSKGGFRRLMDGGFSCENAKINYLPSFTAPGHACIYTGSVPAIHGITGNEWFEGGRDVYCTEDDTTRPVGGSWRWGRMSPRNLLTTTVTDELRLATNFRSRVFSISLKDRGSILPGGHLANAAFWFDDSTGNFASSGYYMNALPQWVQQFNSARYADSILARDWDLLDDSLTYVQSGPPNARYEGAYDKNETRVGFSHRAGFFRSTGATKYNAVRKLPAGNWLSFAFARECVTANGLGRHADPDMLAISLSATDYIGHQFGPDSREIEDTYRRLDRDIEAFLRFLDGTVGKGRYTVFLTADHGAAHNALFLSDRRIPAENVSIRTLQAAMNDHLKQRFGADSIVFSLFNYQVWFDAGRLPAGVAMDRVIRESIDWLRLRPEIAFAADLISGPSNLPEPLNSMAVNGYHPGRSGFIQYMLKPGSYSGYAQTGTTHGSWNPYDTHIPLLWYGWGIRQGVLHREVDMTDIAATLAALLKIQMPNGCVGTVIPEVLR